VEDLTDYIVLTDAREIGAGGYATVWSATFARPNVPPRQVSGLKDPLLQNGCQKFIVSCSFATGCSQSP